MPVLLIDDHQDTVDLLSLALRINGLIVHACNDFETALDIAEKVHPAVIIMDFHVGGMSVERFINQLPDDDQTKLVIVSGDQNAEMVASAVGAAFIMKPVDIDILRSLCMKRAS
jgi:DNA-binding NtrC family response regulator